MKYTKDSVIKVLKALRKQAHEVASIYKEKGDLEEYSNRISEACGYSTAIYLLEDPDFFRVISNTLSKELE